MPHPSKSVDPLVPYITVIPHDCYLAILLRLQFDCRRLSDIKQQDKINLNVWRLTVNRKCRIDLRTEKCCKLSCVDHTECEGCRQPQTRWCNLPDFWSHTTLLARPSCFTSDRPYGRNSPASGYNFRCMAKPSACPNYLGQCTKNPLYVT